MGATGQRARLPISSRGWRALAIGWVACLILLVVGPARADARAEPTQPLCDIASAGGLEAVVAPRPAELEEAEDCGGAMCDPSAASVVAEPSVPWANGGSVDELPCEAWASWLAHDWRVLMDSAVRGFAAHGDSSPGSAVQPRTDLAKALPSIEPCAAPATPALLGAPARRTIRPHAGFARLPYRPPLDSTPPAGA